MTHEQIIHALRKIVSPQALPAAVENELEDLGLIAQTDQPYARLTEAGREMLS